MASEKQVLANRRNSQRSTGPRTPEGKAAVSQNAIKHGLRARGTLFVPSAEGRRTVRKSLATEWRPKTRKSGTSSNKWPSPSICERIISRRQAALTRSYCKALQSLLRLRLARPAVPLAEAAEPQAAAGTCPMECRSWTLMRLMRPLCKPSRAQAIKNERTKPFFDAAKFPQPSAPACKRGARLPASQPHRRNEK